jgi:membrane protein YqaA with SNARE-associated domain
MINNYFQLLFNKTLDYSGRKKSWIVLSFISFIESIFFPIPTDLFLAPMIMANRKKTVFLISITILFSVLGGIIGYIIGFYFWESIAPKMNIIYPAFQEGFLNFKNKFSELSWVLIIIGGFTPFPFKIITISSGILQLDIFLFIGCSIISRSARFILVGYMFFKYGKDIKSTIQRHINLISLVLILVFLGYIFIKFYKE